MYRGTVLSAICSLDHRAREPTNGDGGGRILTGVDVRVGGHVGLDWRIVTDFDVGSKRVP